jgi:nitronate monooxygenase
MLQGHPGEGDVGNYVLQAKGAKVLKTPFVCSGGVGDGKQLAAALALGAEGVNMGTRFCATQECNWPQSFKQRMVDASEEDTVLMFRRLHNTARVFGNKVAKEVQAIEQDKGKDIQFDDVMHLVVGNRGREAEANGDPDGGIWSAGQVVGIIDDCPSCADVMTRFMAEAEDTITSRLRAMVGPSKL